MNPENTIDHTEELLSLDKPNRVLKVLQKLQLCDTAESVVSIEKAGEGNMNLVMRVTTDRQSLIVKQARPWVEKYPSIAAPAERILAEINFYERVAKVPSLAEMMPAVLGRDLENRVLVLQDLGPTSDYASLFEASAGDEIRDGVFEQAAKWLADLHQHCRSSDALQGCRQLRELNHAHMFSIPFSNPSAIELDTVCQGLTDASVDVRGDEQLHDAINRLGTLYLDGNGSGGTLLHGDYYPGSWLSTENGFRVIDPEFCFDGPCEFDLGVMCAHYVFCHAPTKIETVQRLVEIYGGAVSMPLVLGFAGVELLRRLIGVAQLPLVADLDQRKQWLALGADFIMRSTEFNYAKTD